MNMIEESRKKFKVQEEEMYDDFFRSLNKSINNNGANMVDDLVNEIGSLLMRIGVETDYGTLRRIIGGNLENGIVRTTGEVRSCIQREIEKDDEEKDNNLVIDKLEEFDTKDNTCFADFKHRITNAIDNEVARKPQGFLRVIDEVEDILDSSLKTFLIKIKAELLPNLKDDWTDLKEKYNQEWEQLASQNLEQQVSIMDALKSCVDGVLLETYHSSNRNVDSDMEYAVVAITDFLYNDDTRFFLADEVTTERLNGIDKKDLCADLVTMALVGEELSNKGLVPSLNDETKKVIGMVKANGNSQEAVELLLNNNGLGTKLIEDYVKIAYTVPQDERERARENVDDKYIYHEVRKESSLESMFK